MKTTVPFLSNSTYDKTKWVAQIFLPGLGTLYFTLAGIWGSSAFPEADKVVGTIMAFDLFLGVLLGLSTVAYAKSGARFDGHIQLEEHETGTTASMILKEEPEVALAQPELTFAVETEGAPPAAKKPARKRAAKNIVSEKTE